MLLVVGILIVSIGTLSYLRPQKLAYTTLSDQVSASRPQSVTAQVADRMVTLHIFSGPGQLGQYFAINGAPTLSKFTSNGTTNVSVHVTLYTNDASTHTQNSEYTIR